MNASLPSGAEAHRWLRLQNKLKGNYMLYTIAVVLIVLWLLGLVSGYAMGGLIHALLLIAIVMVLLNLISGRKRI
jgi:hypothetical protein